MSLMDESKLVSSPGGGSRGPRARMCPTARRSSCRSLPSASASDSSSVVSSRSRSPTPTPSPWVSRRAVADATDADAGCALPLPRGDRLPASRTVAD